MSRRNLWLGVVLAFGLLVPGSAAAQSNSCLYAIDFEASSTFNTKLYRVNSADGTMIGAGVPITHNGVGLGSMIDIEFKSDGYLYGVTTFVSPVPAHSSALFKINPINGQAELIGPVNIGLIGEGDLSFDAGETLYLSTATQGRLYTLDLATGQGTLTGTLPGFNHDLSSIGFNGANELWALDNWSTPSITSMLLKINPAGGAILPPTPQAIGFALGALGGMDWSAAQNRFYTADGGNSSTKIVRLLDTGGPSFATVGTTDIPGGIAGLTVCRRTCVTPPPYMVAWYKFGEKAGTTTAEIAPLGSPVLAHNPGTKFGASGTLGVVGIALHFDGVDDYVEAPHQSWINFGSGSFSIDLWIRIPAGASEGIRSILDKRDDEPKSAGYHLALTGTGGEPLLQLANGTGYTNYHSGLALADGQWHFLAVTVDRSAASPAIRWYLDGVPAGAVGDPSDRSGSLDNTVPLRIGRRSPSFTDPGWLSGDLDELELFSRVLTASQIQSIFAAGRAGKCTAILTLDGPEEK
jgi:Concanavalin A-like lectin/glucanases superfamily